MILQFLDCLLLNVLIKELAFCVILWVPWYFLYDWLWYFVILLYFAHVCLRHVLYFRFACSIFFKIAFVLKILDVAYVFNYWIILFFTHFPFFTLWSAFSFWEMGIFIWNFTCKNMQWGLSCLLIYHVLFFICDIFWRFICVLLFWGRV